MATLSLCFIILQLLSVAFAAEPSAFQRVEDPYKWIKLHGWLMWGSFGLLIPLGTLVVRFSRCARHSREAASDKIAIVFYAHLIIQSIALLVSAGGAVLSFRKFSNQFMHTHQRLGLALWAVAWVQPFIGIIRPRTGQTARPVWFVLHWLLGTTTIILGFYNVYNGLRIYEMITQKSQRTLNILFSIQIAVMAVIYLLQDKWNYVKEQSSSGFTKAAIAPPMVRQYSVSSHRKYYTAA
ncbi:cytochrome b561 domain-containing protein At4g18260 [Selaginella moellendorffii]|nr:cytochrome b561 domain-containing protein At4g18260 [Selaginella moellendorffii]XP_024538997.1 cytochrome b561 domain-containing protein At4g18260 [Selaginella moellendorffii]|eukprot:XP_002978115.2 cytochrome b561 domain-containing protein At4g18260 [Selaginella moellendorffii]